MFSETTGTHTVAIMTNRTSDAMKKRFLMARARLNEGVVLDDIDQSSFCTAKSVLLIWMLTPL